MHQHPNGKVCHLNGCTEGETVPIVCPGCEKVIGHAPKGGMAQASATHDRIVLHLRECGDSADHDAHSARNRDHPEE